MRQRWGGGQSRVGGEDQDGDQLGAGRQAVVAVVLLPYVTVN